jgi:xanthosine utilization system XapX-like protein
VTIDITQIVVAVLGLLGLIITTVLVPWIKSKITNEQWQMIVNYAYAGVQAAEIIFNAQGQGEAKFAWVADYIEQRCAEHGIKIDTDTIKVVIENAWKEFGLDKHD